MSKKLLLRDQGRVKIRKKFPETITHKISGANSSFHSK